MCGVGRLVGGGAVCVIANPVAAAVHGQFMSFTRGVALHKQHETAVVRIFVGGSPKCFLIKKLNVRPV